MLIGNMRIGGDGVAGANSRGWAHKRWLRVQGRLQDR